MRFATNKKTAAKKALAEKELRGDTLQFLEAREMEEYVCLELNVEEVAQQPLNWVFDDEP